MIMEEVNSNPILTEEELRNMMYFPSEEEHREEEKVTERICQRIENLLEETNWKPSEEQINQIITEENYWENF